MKLKCQKQVWISCLLRIINFLHRPNLLKALSLMMRWGSWILLRSKKTRTIFFWEWANLFLKINTKVIYKPASKIVFQLRFSERIITTMMQQKSKKMDLMSTNSLRTRILKSITPDIRFWWTRRLIVLALLMMDWCFNSLSKSTSISHTSAELQRRALTHATLNYSKCKRCSKTKKRKRRESGLHHWVETKQFFSLDLATTDISRSTPTLIQCFTRDKKQTHGTNLIIYSAGRISWFPSSSMESWTLLNHFILARILSQLVRDKKSSLLEQIH